MLLTQFDNSATLIEGSNMIFHSLIFVPEGSVENRGRSPSNIHKVAREVLKTEGEARGFQPS